MPRKLTFPPPSAYNGSMFVSALSRYTDLLYGSLFFLYLTGGTFPFNAYQWQISLIVAALCLITVIPLFRTSSRPKLQTYAVPAGICCGALVFVLLELVFPLLPVWEQGMFSIIRTFIVALTCYRKNHVRLIRISAFSVLITLLTGNAAMLAGVVKNAPVYLERGVIRSGLGSAHPNALSMLLVTLIATVYLGNCFRSVLVNLFLTCCVYLFCANFTHTRTGCLMCAVLGIAQLAEWLYANHKHAGKVLSLLLPVLDVIAVFAFPLNCLLWYGLYALYERQVPLALTINSVMANRLMLALETITEHGITAFGSRITEGEYIWTDSGYATFLANYGVVSVVLLSILWTLAAYRFLKKKQRRYLYAFAMVALWGGEGNAIYDVPPNYFFFLALSDLTEETDPAFRTVTPFLSVFVVIPVLPFLFVRMRTMVERIIPLIGSIHRLNLMIIVSCAVVAVLLWGICSLAGSRIRKQPLSKKHLAAVCVCALILCFHVLFGNRLLQALSPEAVEMIDDDAGAIETILSAKTGSLYVDPYPAFYRQRFPGISPSVLYGKDLSRKKRATVLTDADLDGTNTFITQGFSYAEISEDHAVYTNDAPVISALRQEGFHVTPYFSREVHVDLEECAELSNLTYDEFFPGIYVDQISHRSPQIWNNDNVLFTGDYLATFTFRILYHEENDPDAYCKLAVNYGFGSEIASDMLYTREMDEEGVIVKQIPFRVESELHGAHVVFSVYDGDIRRLFVQDISYVRLE